MTEFAIKSPMIRDAQLVPERPVTPIEYEITLSIKPLSTATITVDRNDAPPFHGWMELFTSRRSAGIFRVAQMTDTIDGTNNVKLTLEHGICVLRDAIVTATADEATYVATDTRSVVDDGNGTTSHVSFRGTKEQVRASCINYQNQDPGYTPNWAISTEDNNIYFEGTPEAVLRQILMYQTVSVGGQALWTVGTVEPNNNVKLKVDHDVCLDLLDDLMDELPDCMLTFDQSTLPWRVGIARRPSTVSAEGRLCRNMTRADIDYDDSELYTRVYMEDLPGGYMDADTVSTYGVIGYYQKAGNALSQGEKEAICRQFLNKHKIPKVSIDIDAVELWQLTGVGVDDVEIGALYRLALPDYGIVIEQHVVTMFYSSVFDNPGVVMITLASDSTSLVSKLSEMKKEIKGGGGGGAARDKELEEDAEREKIRYDLKVEYDKKHFQILATEEEWSDAWDDYFLTNKTKFYQDARKFALIASEQEFDDLETGDTTLKEQWDSNLTLTAQKLNLVFNDTEYADLQQIREDAGQLYADATMFSLMFSHQDLLDIINSHKTMFKMTQDQIALRVEKGGVATELSVECGNVSITGGNLVVDGYVTAREVEATYATITNLDTEKGRINSILGGTATLSGIICAGNISAVGGVSASGVYVNNTDLSTAISSIGTASESGGQISIPTTRLNGNPGPLINFNIAATNYFQTEVAAAAANARAEFTPATVTLQGTQATIETVDTTTQINLRSVGLQTLYDANGNSLGNHYWYWSGANRYDGYYYQKTSVQSNYYNEGQTVTDTYYTHTTPSN